jgi:hypothetical protein
LDPLLMPQTKPQKSRNHERSTQAITAELSKPGLRCIITENLFS